MLSIPALSLSLSLSLCFTIPPSKLLLLLSFLLARAPSADAYCSLLSTLILLSALASLSLPPLTVCVCVSFSQSLSTEPPEPCSHLLCHFLFATHLLVHK